MGVLKPCHRVQLHFQPVLGLSHKGEMVSLCEIFPPPLHYGTEHFLFTIINISHWSCSLLILLVGIGLVLLGCLPAERVSVATQGIGRWVPVPCLISHWLGALRCPAGRRRKDAHSGGFGLQKHRRNQLSDKPHFYSLGGEESGRLLTVHL